MEEESGVAKKVGLNLVRTPNNKVEPTNEAPATTVWDKSSTNTKSTTTPDTTVTTAAIASTLTNESRGDTNQEATTAVTAKGANRVAKLSYMPKSLSELWEEWHIGIEGNKPAKLFTAKERGKVKHSFSRRKPIWDQISKLVASGMSSEAACNKMYAIYGEGKSVIYYSMQLKKDKQERGGHPDLNVTNLPTADADGSQADSTTNIGQQQQQQHDRNPRASAGDRIYLCQLTNDFIRYGKKTQFSGSKPNDADAGTREVQRPGRIRACPGGDVVKVLLQLPPANAKLGLIIESDKKQHKGLPVLTELSPNSPYRAAIPPRMLGGAYWIVGVRDESRGYAVVMDCAMLLRELNIRRKPREDTLVEFVFAKRRSEDSLQAASGGNNDQTAKSVFQPHHQGRGESETMHENQINVNTKYLECKPSEEHQLVTQEQEQKEVKRDETQQKSHEQKRDSLITMQNSKGDNIEQRSLTETSLPSEIVDGTSSKHKLTQAVEKHQPQKLEEKISLNKRCEKRKSELQQDHGVVPKKSKVTRTSNTPTEGDTIYNDLC